MPRRASGMPPDEHPGHLPPPLPAAEPAASVPPSSASAAEVVGPGVTSQTFCSEGHVSPSGARFCLECGEALGSVTCPNGHAMPRKAKFCSECAATLVQPEVPPAPVQQEDRNKRPHDEMAEVTFVAGGGTMLLGLSEDPPLWGIWFKNDAQGAPIVSWPLAEEETARATFQRRAPTAVPLDPPVKGKCKRPQARPDTAARPAATSQDNVLIRQPTSRPPSGYGQRPPASSGGRGTSRRSWVLAVVISALAVAVVGVVAGVLLATGGTHSSSYIDGYNFWVGANQRAESLLHTKKSNLAVPPQGATSNCTTYAQPDQNPPVMPANDHQDEWIQGCEDAATSGATTALSRS